MTPLISVLIPIFNGEMYLQESLDSLYTQSFTDFEIVIVDDGSTDKTAQIINSQSDSRIRYFKNDHNSGIVYTLNRGLALCKGAYIARMDADDISLADRLKCQFAFMESHPEYVLCGTSLNKFSESYSFIDQRGGLDDDIRTKLLFDTAINHPSAMIRKSVLDAYNLKYPTIYPHAEDYGFWVSLSAYGKVANLEDVLVRYRMHGDNISMKFNHQQYLSMNKIRIEGMANFWKNIEGDHSNWLDSYRQILLNENPRLEDFLKLDHLLVEMIDANRKVNIYPESYIVKYAAWFWYVVFFYENRRSYNPSFLFKYLFNSHSICKYLDRSNKKKFLLKSLFFYTKK